MAKAESPNTPICPFRGTDAKGALPCVETDCALWMEESNEKFSGCVLARIGYVLKRISFADALGQSERTRR